MVIVSMGDVNWARQVAALGFAVRRPATKVLAPAKQKPASKAGGEGGSQLPPAVALVCSGFRLFVKQAAKTA